MVGFYKNTFGINRILEALSEKCILKSEIKVLKRLIFAFPEHS